MTGKIATLLLISFALPQLDEWKLIGQRKVIFVLDKDEIAVNTTQPLPGIRSLAKGQGHGHQRSGGSFCQRR